MSSQGNVTNDSLKTTTGAAIASLAYGYYPSGRLKTKTTNGLTGSTTQSYTYDQAGRLNSWNNGAASTAYAYDGNGNLTADGTNTATYNQRNQLTSQNTTGTTYTYSPRGTRTSSTSGSNTSTATYDAFDQLTAQAGKTYTYDALGRLTQTAGHSFTYDATSSTLTSDGTEKYTRTPGGSLTTIGANGAAAFAYTDRHGDLVGNFTATASTTGGSSAYDPWGKPTATSGTTHSIGYQGGWTDSATGQISTASHWYDPASAGFTSRDTANLEPVTSSIANRYSYGAADPLDNTDPTGHNPCDTPTSPGPGGSGPTPNTGYSSSYWQFSYPTRVTRNIQELMEQQTSRSSGPKGGAEWSSARDYGKKVKGKSPKSVQIQNEMQMRRFGSFGYVLLEKERYGRAAGYSDCADGEPPHPQGPRHTTATAALDHPTRHRQPQQQQHTRPINRQRPIGWIYADLGRRYGQPIGHPAWIHAEPGPGLARSWDRARKHPTGLHLGRSHTGSTKYSIRSLPGR
ncbi:RHS repeat-associated core domain-containing protein [Kitasatospora sp. P5_F3]